MNTFSDNQITKCVTFIMYNTLYIVNIRYFFMFIELTCSFLLLDTTDLCCARTDYNCSLKAQGAHLTPPGHSSILELLTLLDYKADNTCNNLPILRLIGQYLASTNDGWYSYSIDVSIRDSFPILLPFFVKITSYSIFSCHRGLVIMVFEFIW